MKREGACPRCGADEHVTSVEALACIEVHGSRRARARTRAWRDRLRSDPAYAAAIAAALDRVEP